MSIFPAKSRAVSVALAVCAASTLAAPVVRAETPRVVVTIKPVHSLVASVMDGVAKPYLILKGGASPHAYSLRPSEARRLARANLVFWIGEGLEAFMEKPLASLAKKATVVELHEVKGVHLLKIREGGIWEGHEHADEDHDHKKHDAHEEEHHHNDKKAEAHKHEHKHKDEQAHKGDHEHGENDMHIWLDPHNAEAMVRAIEAALIKLDPDNAAAYRRNAKATIDRLEKLEKELDKQLAPVRTRRYIVFHDAFQYFEKRYRLAAFGSITLHPQRQPGAERISTLRKRLISGQIRCIFAEPQFPPKLVATLVSGTKVKRAVLDPVGAAIPEGKDAYFTLMRTIAGSLRTCLQ